MRFKCARGFWRPIEINSKEGAQLVFHCAECAVRTTDCLQAVFGDNSSITALAGALDAMRNIKPGTIRIPQTWCENRYAKRGLREVVATLYDEIKAAHDAGHGFGEIAKVISVFGPHISSTTLKCYFRKMGAEA
jgi:hypothetical protein